MLGTAPIMNCLHCQKITKNPKFCSRSCSASHNNRKNPKRSLKTRYCTQCDAILDRKTWKDCSRLCLACKDSNNYKDKTLEEYHERCSVKGKHPSWINSHIRLFNRSWNRDMVKLPCATCGYSKHVELCHIRAITDFPETALLGEVNAPSNIIQLCRNCHWELDNNVSIA